MESRREAGTSTLTSLSSWTPAPAGFVVHGVDEAAVRDEVGGAGRLPAAAQDDARAAVAAGQQANPRRTGRGAQKPASSQ